MSYRILTSIVRQSFSVGFAFALLTGELAAQQEKPQWAERQAVSDSTDTVHLDFRQLRTWTLTDVSLAPEARFLAPEFKSLWKSVLDSKDRELRRNALLSIGQAHEGGYDDFSDLVDNIRATFNRDDLRPITRVDAARTLVILDARSAASDLMKQLNEPGIRQITEPAFARWNYEPARSMWMKRLTQPDQVPRSHLVLAIQCLGQIKSAGAKTECRKITLSSRFDVGLRVIAARTLAGLQTSGLKEVAQQLLARKKPGSDLVGATLLRNHSGDATEQILTGLLEHSSPPVAAIAWERLNRLNPERIPAAVLAKTFVTKDARLRQLAVQNGFLRQELPLERLTSALDDHHPDVRRAARHALRDREHKAVREADSKSVGEIHAATSKALSNGYSWRGLEQACLLAAEIDHDRAATRIAELLRHERTEVASAAAYSLKELAVEGVLPQMLAYASELDQELMTPDKGNPKRVEVIQPHLFESFAEHNYRAAEPLLRKYVPKADPRFSTCYSRMTAIWSLAYLHQESPDPGLVAQLKTRMMDWSSIPPEMDEIVLACALAFGIMKEESAIPQLRKLAGAMPVQAPGRAACWAINQITGEPIPPKPGMEKSRSQWFLAPLKRSSHLE